MLYHVRNEMRLTEVDPSFSLARFVNRFEDVFRWDNSFALSLLPGLGSVSLV